MLTRLRIRNFKGFDDIDIELARSVVFVGPNNSGKTSALQALSLWEVGLRKWQEKYAERTAPEKRPGVTVGRRDLLAIPLPAANLLWRGLRTQKAARSNGKGQTHIPIEITVDGLTHGRAWSCGLEFDYANEESIYCRPLRVENGDDGARMPVPADAYGARVAMLPPMSGLAANETLLLPGRIEVLIGEGQTAQVLRNLCYSLRERAGGVADWDALVARLREMFGIELLPPALNHARGEISMSYLDRSGTELDLSCSGRGLQQTLLLLSYLYSNPGTALLLDEPDAHLEVLRQREIYDVLTDLAATKGCQILAASHSEVVLETAAKRDVVIAFVGRPHRIDDRGFQLAKSLKEIGYEQFYLAEETGWVLYGEGHTDLAILQRFAETLGHAAVEYLRRPFFCPVKSNVPELARKHFFGVREAKPDLVGLALFDRIDKELQRDTELTELMWRRREIENYLCSEKTLLGYARHELPDDLFGREESERRVSAMRASIEEVRTAIKRLKRADIWSADLRASEEVLDPVFEAYFEKLGLPNLMRKTDYHVLAGLVARADIDSEVVEKLDAIAGVARRATPRAN